MRIQLIAILATIGCQVASEDTAELTEAVIETVTEARPTGATDHLKQIFDEVSFVRIGRLMRELSGVEPVIVNGEKLRLGERFSATGRQNFRDYWIQTMRDLGLEINQFHYQAARHPRPGDNVEAVLGGPSADSIIVVVHYDSIGPRG